MNLKKTIESYASAGLSAKVVDAPKDANNFDKMIVVYSSPACKTIKMVTMYSTKEGKVVGHHS